MTEVPQHIQDQVDKARKLQEELIKTQNPEEPALEPEEEEEVEVEAEEAEEVEADGVEGEEAEEVEAAEPEVPREETLRYWKDRFSVLESKYNAEVPRYAQEVRELKALLRQQEAKVALLEEKKVEVTPEVKALDPSAFEDYGDEVVNMANVLNSAVATIEKLNVENARLKEGYEGVQRAAAQTGIEQMLASLRAELPKFDEQNNDPAFWKWCDEYGFSLAEISETLDYDKALKVFSLYRSTENAYEPEASAVQSSGVARQVSPTRSKPGTAVAPKKKVWTRAEIKQTYDDIARGIISDEKAMELKADILRAPAEGRIG